MQSARNINPGKEDPDPAYIPALFSRETRIPNFCHRYPEYSFFS